MEINAIATGKKPLSFLDYETVITPSHEANVLSSVNLVCQGKILVKIRTNITLDQTNADILDRIVKQTITSFLNGKETGAAAVVQDVPKATVRAQKKHKKARARAAEDLFTTLNL